MRVLITGASGFVGSWLVRRLRADGITVRILRRKSSTAGHTDHGLEIYWGDVTDAESLAAAARDVHTVFHLAGHIGYSRADRELMERVNVMGTRNVIQACRSQRVTRLVHMSSVVAVGASFDGRSPLNENSIYDIGHLNLGYFETKRAAERAVLDAARAGEIDAVCVNPSTIYGAGDATKGSRKIQLKVAQGRFPFYTSGGVSVIAIEDVISATIAAWQRGRSGERYILSGENITIQQLFATIAECAGATAPNIFLPNPLVKAIGRCGDALERIGRKGALNSESAWTAILYHWFDNSKAQNELGLRTRPAAQAIAASVGWMKENGLLK